MSDDYELCLSKVHPRPEYDGLLPPLLLFLELSGTGGCNQRGSKLSFVRSSGCLCAYIVPPSADAVVADFPPGRGAGVVGPALAAEPAGTPGVGAGGAGAAPRVAPPRPGVQTVEKVVHDHSLDSKCGYSLLCSSEKKFRLLLLFEKQYRCSQIDDLRPAVPLPPPVGVDEREPGALALAVPPGQGGGGGRLSNRSSAPESLGPSLARVQAAGDLGGKRLKGLNRHWESKIVAPPLRKEPGFGEQSFPRVRTAGGAKWKCLTATSPTTLFITIFSGNSQDVFGTLGHSLAPRTVAQQ